STARQAAALGREAGVRLLALVHVSSRYDIRDVLAEAREEFSACEAPRDFDVVEVPFPERGAPRLIESGARAAAQAEPSTRAARRGRRSPGPLRSGGPPGGSASPATGSDRQHGALPGLLAADRGQSPNRALPRRCGRGRDAWRARPTTGAAWPPSAR